MVWSEGIPGPYIASGMVFTGVRAKASDRQRRLVNTAAGTIPPACRWQMHRAKLTKVNGQMSSRSETRSTLSEALKAVHLAVAWGAHSGCYLPADRSAPLSTPCAMHPWTSLEPHNGQIHWMCTEGQETRQVSSHRGPWTGQYLPRVLPDYSTVSQRLWKSSHSVVVELLGCRVKRRLAMEL